MPINHPLAVELLNQALKRRHTETTTETATETTGTGDRTTETSETSETADEAVAIARLAVVSGDRQPHAEPTAEQRMWAYYVTVRAKGRTPTGAELDRIAAARSSRPLS